MDGSCGRIFVIFFEVQLLSSLSKVSSLWIKENFEDENFTASKVTVKSAKFAFLEDYHI